MDPLRSRDPKIAATLFRSAVHLLVVAVVGLSLGACNGTSTTSAAPSTTTTSSTGTGTGSGSGSGGDTTAPTITITSPTSGTTYSSSNATITLAGSASDNVGVTQVTWSNSVGGSGSATLGGSGTTRSWSTSVALQSGSNTITVTARDSAGNTGTDSITVTYTPPVNTYMLNVTVSGSGTVSSNPTGISNCSGTCAYSYNSGTSVTLTAAPGTGATFSGWSGACSGSSSTCTVTMSAARNVTATFTSPSYALTVSLAGAGSGTVTSAPAGINCGTSCSSSFTSGTLVTLSAIASNGDTFTGWGGACSGTNSSCTVTMSAAQAVSATFTTSTAGSGSDLCASAGIQGTSLVNFSALAKPAKGQAVTDPDFGTTIRRITDAQGDWGASVAVPAYPTIQAWNSDESLMILYVTSPFHGWALFNGKTYAFIRWLDINPADVEQFYWSTSDPHTLFYVNNYQNGSANHEELTKVTLSTDGTTDTQTVLHDFANDIASGALHSLCNNSSVYVSGGEDPFFMSYDNDLIGLGCYEGKNGPGGSADFGAFSYRISTNTIGTPFTIEADVPQATPSGTATYIYSSSSTVSVLNPVTNAVQRTINYSGAEHSDMVRSATGDDLVAGPQFDGPSGSGTLMVANLSKGGVKTIISHYPPSGTLVSGKSWQNPGWVALADTGNINATQTYLDQEVLLANVDTGEYCRIAHNRSTGNWNGAALSNYWAQPNVVISPSGTRVLFASDWGAANPGSGVTANPSAVVDTYVIELPGYHG